MYKKDFKKVVLTLFTVVMVLVIPVQQAMAYGGLTHYSMTRDANRNSIEELSASNAPDALNAFYYGANGLETFAHMELPGVLYGPLDYYVDEKALGDSQKLWAAGWGDHNKEDRSSHGTYLPGSPYLYPDNYLSAAGANTLLAHLKAEFAGDILSYWLNKGIMPESIIVYPDQVGRAFGYYDSDCSTNYLTEYDAAKYLKAFESLHATIYAEQRTIDYRQDKKLQYNDLILLIWAYRTYYNPYNKYYGLAVGNIKETTAPIKVCVDPSAGTTNTMVEETKIRSLENIKIKTDTGRQLIENGLIVPNEKFDKKTGAVTLDFLQTVSDDELAKAYESYLGKAYEKQTGKKAKIHDEITSEAKRISIRDIKKDYPELFQKLIDKGEISELIRQKQLYKNQ